MRRLASSTAFAALCSRDAASLTAVPAASASAVFVLIVDLPEILAWCVTMTGDSARRPTPHPPSSGWKLKHW